jgi:hypothetical protein
VLAVVLFVGSTWPVLAWICAIIATIGFTAAWCAKKRDKCPICQGNIRQNYKVLRWHGNDENSRPIGGSVETGWCDSCNLKLIRRVDSDPAWIATDVQKSWLSEKLSSKELTILNNKLGQYEIIGREWNEFLGRLKKQDELWRYNNPNTFSIGICVVREGIPVADFSTPGNL